VADRGTGIALGLSCGANDGSAEILLKSALQAAEQCGASVELVRLHDLHLSLTGEPDDGEWLWERLVACDALVVSTPIISRTVSAVLKLAIDRLLGPKADAAFVERMIELRREGAELKLPFKLDDRVLKSRVAGFIAVGGSLTSQWKSLAMPILHTTAFSMHMAVADQRVFGGAGTPRSIVLEPDALALAAQLGRNVAEQIGVEHDDVEFRGEEGLCPLCHLDVIVLTGRNVECATCGARGKLNDDVHVRWTDLSTSVLTMDEKRAHVHEVEQTAAAHAERRDEIERIAASYCDYDRRAAPASIS